MKKVSWPAVEKTHMRGTAQLMSDGEPHLRQLRRFSPNRSLMASSFDICCDCKLRHHTIYYVFVDAAQQWWLSVVAYRDVEGTKALKSKKRK